MVVSHEVKRLKVFKAPLMAQISNFEQCPLFHFSRCLCSGSLGFGQSRTFKTLDVDSLIREAGRYLRIPDHYRPTIICVESLR